MKLLKWLLHLDRLDEFQEGYVAALNYVLDILPNGEQYDMEHFRNHLAEDIESMGGEVTRQPS